MRDYLSMCSKSMRESLYKQFCWSIKENVTLERKGAKGSFNTSFKLSPAIACLNAFRTFSI